MFKKLRNRFLLMNMVIISIIMLVAFTAIYTITYQDVRRDIGIELQQVSEFYRKPGGNIDKGGMGMGSGMSGGMGDILTDKEETVQSMQQMPGDRARRSSRGQNPPPSSPSRLRCKRTGTGTCYRSIPASIWMKNSTSSPRRRPISIRP